MPSTQVGHQNRPRKAFVWWLRTGPAKPPTRKRRPFRWLVKELGIVERTGKGLNKIENCKQEVFLGLRPYRDKIIFF